MEGGYLATESYNDANNRLVSTARSIPATMVSATTR